MFKKNVQTPARASPHTILPGLAPGLASLSATVTAAAATTDDLEALVQAAAQRLAERDARIRALENRAAPAPASSLSTPAPASSLSTPAPASSLSTPAPVAPVATLPAAAPTPSSAVGRPEPQAGELGPVSIVKATPGGFSVGSADGGNQLRSHAVLNVDGRHFDQPSVPQGTDGWWAVVLSVREIGAIARLELAAEGRDSSLAPLEADINRERHARERFLVGKQVSVPLRRWQIYPAVG